MFQLEQANSVWVGLKGRGILREPILYPSYGARQLRRKRWIAGNIEESIENSRPSVTRDSVSDAKDTNTQFEDFQ